MAQCEYNHVKQKIQKVQLVQISISHLNMSFHQMFPVVYICFVSVIIYVSVLIVKDIEAEIEFNMSYIITMIVPTRVA